MLFLAVPTTLLCSEILCWHFEYWALEGVWGVPWGGWLITVLVWVWAPEDRKCLL